MLKKNYAVVLEKEEGEVFIMFYAVSLSLRMTVLTTLACGTHCSGSVLAPF